MLRPSDYVVLATVLLAGIGSSVYMYNRSLSQKGECRVVAEVDGEAIYARDLSSDSHDTLVSLDLPRGRGTLEVSGPRVRMMPMPDSTCPLHICSQTGWIERPGQFIACVPNRLIVTIIGPAKTGPDTLDAITP
jgi:hypothetical protein